MNHEERLRTLVRLGLTLNQARVYLALILSGPAGARKLSETARITRQDVYRVMPLLEQKGIVEKLIRAPTVYKAIPISHGAQILVSHKKVEYKELSRKTGELVREIEKSSAKQEFEESDVELIMIPGIDAMTQKIRETLQKTRRSVDVVTSRQRFSPTIIELKVESENALKRGVRIRIATEKYVAERAVLQIANHLMKIGGFEVKSFSDAPTAVVSIFDRKEASVTLSKTASTPKASALWSNDACFIALADNYFKTKWSNSTVFIHAFSTS